MRNFGLMAAVCGCAVAAGCGGAVSTPAASGPSQADKDREAILRVLHADRELARKRDALPPKATPTQIAWAIGRYCDQSERLPTTDCPADFRVAYRHHRDAWREAQAAIGRLPDDFFEGVFMGAMNALLRGEVDGGTSRLEGDVKRTLDRARDTRIELEKVGARYGAAL